MENNLKRGKTWNEIPKPADDMAAPLIGMVVRVKTRKPHSTHTTTNILKTISGGRKSSLTDQKVTVSVKCICNFDWTKYIKPEPISLSKLEMSKNQKENFGLFGVLHSFNRNWIITNFMTTWFLENLVPFG